LIKFLASTDWAPILLALLESMLENYLALQQQRSKTTDASKHQPPGQELEKQLPSFLLLYK
jgi:hypothetical protein